MLCKHVARCASRSNFVPRDFVGSKEPAQIIVRVEFFTQEQIIIEREFEISQNFNRGRWLTYRFHQLSLGAIRFGTRRTHHFDDRETHDTQARTVSAERTHARRSGKNARAAEPPVHDSFLHTFSHFIDDGSDDNCSRFFRLFARWRRIRRRSDHLHRFPSVKKERSSTALRYSHRRQN